MIQAIIIDVEKPFSQDNLRRVINRLEKNRIKSVNTIKSEQILKVINNESSLREHITLSTFTGFFRIHKSLVVDLNFISEYDRRNGFSAILLDDILLPVAIRMNNELISLQNPIDNPDMHNRPV